MQATDERPQDWVIDKAMASTTACPADLLEELMADERCIVFGPIHHFIAGAALLACWHNAQGRPDRDVRLREDLEELLSRSNNVPGATCAHWGVCGAAASAGMAYAIVRENHPLREEGWGDGLLVVSHLLESIARSGSPRCCKRDARVAVADAVDHFNALGEAPLEKAATPPVCSVFPQNTVCAGALCAYHPAHE